MSHEAKREGPIDRKWHWGDLFDENEDPAGGLTDPATGEKIDNSTYTGMEDLRELVPGKGGSEDVLGALPQEDDTAAQFLRERRKKQEKKK